MNIDRKEACKRLLKYTVHLAGVFLLLRAIPSIELNTQEVTMISFFAACIFAVLDMYMPAIKI